MSITQLCGHRTRLAPALRSIFRTTATWSCIPGQETLRGQAAPIAPAIILAADNGQSCKMTETWSSTRVRRLIGITALFGQRITREASSAAILVLVNNL